MSTAPPASTPPASALRTAPIPSDLLLIDRGKLIALDRKRRELQRQAKPHAELDKRFDALSASAQQRFVARGERHAQLRPTFDDALPIAERRAEIAALIERHQVVIVCGETGSGKTTQLPKICLELGRGRHGMIGCTQPRRIAARSLAQRLAQELKQTGQHTVAYKIRFNDHTDDSTFVKVMTDGILLAETHSDRQLYQYDTLIIDEAHERSLNIDFLLGYVKRLAEKRPELKIIITSATIDPTRFSRHFNDAPVIEVSGRTYPVEIRYRPEHFLDDAEDAVEIEDAVVHAIDEILNESHHGDVLVFLPGEREIRDCAESLRKHTVNAPGAGVRAHLEVLPLYSRLSNAEQDRVFTPSNRRRIVLATNVAETSLTVPGIHYVVDTGVARINRYSPRSKINMLQIEPISQASAKQRAGRCGRVANGIAIRLYEEDDHDARPAFTTPEILRTSLAAVILRMKALGLGDIAAFPFIEPPSPRAVEDGYRQLFELGAVDTEKNLTPLGNTLAKFPIDPSLARMLVAAETESALTEALIIAAALSVQDPRNRPHDKQQEAQLAHEKFAHPQSEFLAFVKLWEFYEDATKHKKSNRKFDLMLIENFLSPLRMREWRDVHAQLAEMVAGLGLLRNETPARYENVHRALLTGLLTNVGTKAVEGDRYLGTRALQFQLPRSLQQHAQQKATRMKWVLAAELTETTRVYARTVASIEPEWIEQLAAHLVTRTHFDPHWERKSGQVIAFEQVALYGLVVNPRKRVHYGAIQPRESREIFIRQGLVSGEVDTHGRFLRHNLKLVAEIEDIESKARRQDVLIDEHEMFALYDAIIPADVVNMHGFERWRKDAEKSNPHVLEFGREQLMRRSATEITFDLFPKSLKLRGATYPLAYRFEPTHAMDGVTITLPVAVLNQVPAARFDWLVMGMLRDKVAALIKTLPQRLRSPLVPVPDTVNDFIEAILKTEGMRDLSAAEAPLTEALSQALKRLRDLEVPKDAWDVARVPPHLNMNFRIVDADGKELAMSRDFAALKAQFADASRTVFSTLHSNRMERDGLTKWPPDLAELPLTINFEKSGIRYDGYPALVDAVESVGIRIMDEAHVSRHNHRHGLVRLAMLHLTEQVKFAERAIKVSPVAAFQFASYFPESKNHVQETFKTEVVWAAFAMTFIDHEGELVRSAADFAARIDAHKGKLIANVQSLAQAMDESLVLCAEVKKMLEERYVKGWEHIGPDVVEQLRHLFAPEFLRDTEGAQLLQFPRYLKAIHMRIEKAKKGAMERDLEHFKSIRALWQQALSVKNRLEPEAAAFRWMLEELRVSMFAQELRTPYPVSVKRVTKAWDDLQNLL
jgi:ATP-dependent helicase HrpA